MRQSVLPVILLLLAPPLVAQSSWEQYGHDPGNQRYSPLTGITRNNVTRLAPAWTYHTGEPRPEPGRVISFEATPLMVDGVLYFATPMGRVIALDPATGRERWVVDTHLDPSLEFGDHTSRGVATWLDPDARDGDPCRRRVIAITIDARMFALDAATGRPCPGFGTGGMVDLRQGLRNPPTYTEQYEVTSPPVVLDGLIVTGSAVADNNNTEAASGEVRAYDARTGAWRWTWDPVPQDSSDPAYDTWRGERAHQSGGANAWTVFAADTVRGLVFLATGSPSVDYFGGTRLGDNRYANSVVALDARTGRLRWAFQTVHHDLWDYDNAAPPVIATIRHEGRRRDVVMEATKTGQLFVLDRDTGEPVFPVEERPVPASTIPGETAAPTQPFSSIPPLVPHQFSAGEAWGVSDSGRAACRAMIEPLRNEGIFTPPSLQGSLVVPSNLGGAHWGGLAFDPERNLAIIPVNRLAAMVQLIHRTAHNADSARPQNNRLGYEYTDMHGTPYVMRRRILVSPDRLPCTPPPFGTLIAVDLERGTPRWTVPAGALPAIGGNPPPAEWGSPELGGPIVTAGGLIFMAGTLDRKLHAYDIDSGRELWSAPLPAAGKATPMTYAVGGKQYVVIAAGGDNDVFGWSDTLVAFALAP